MIGGDLWSRNARALFATLWRYEEKPGSSGFPQMTEEKEQQQEAVEALASNDVVKSINC